MKHPNPMPTSVCQRCGLTIVLRRDGAQAVWTHAANNDCPNPPRLLKELAGLDWSDTVYKVNDLKKEIESA